LPVGYCSFFDTKPGRGRGPKPHAPVLFPNAQAWFQKQEPTHELEIHRKPGPKSLLNELYDTSSFGQSKRAPTLSLFFLLTPILGLKIFHNLNSILMDFFLLFAKRGRFFGSICVGAQLSFYPPGFPFSCQFNLGKMWQFLLNCLTRIFCTTESCLQKKKTTPPPAQSLILF